MSWQFAKNKGLFSVKIQAAKAKNRPALNVDHGRSG